MLDLGAASVLAVCLKGAGFAGTTLGVAGGASAAVLGRAVTVEQAPRSHDNARARPTPTAARASWAACQIRRASIPRPEPGTEILRAGRVFQGG
jgi:hypothetical protein